MRATSLFRGQASWRRLGGGLVWAVALGEVDLYAEPIGEAETEDDPKGLSRLSPIDL